MLQKIWQGALVSGIIFYAGSIFFAPDRCARIEKSGSVVRVFASGLFFLTDNWMIPADRDAVRLQAHNADLFLQEIVTVTFFGRDFRCVPAKRDADAALATDSAAAMAAKRTHHKNEAGVAKEASATRDNPPASTNPYNLPTLPDAPGSDR